MQNDCLAIIWLLDAKWSTVPSYIRFQFGARKSHRLCKLSFKSPTYIVPCQGNVFILFGHYVPFQRQLIRKVTTNCSISCPCSRYITVNWMCLIFMTYWLGSTVSLTKITLPWNLILYIPLRLPTIVFTNHLLRNISKNKGYISKIIDLRLSHRYGYLHSIIPVG